MELLEPGYRIDGFIIGECIHTGGMARIYRVHCADPSEQPDFPIIMKVPRMSADDGAENLVGFEVEKQILSVVHGPHAPRFVAAGDVSTLPYLVMEYIEGRTLQDWLDKTAQRDPAEIARIGALIAHAVHSLHQQEVCHLDLKPANVLLKSDDGVVLLDFGLSWHAHYPDLLAEEMRSAAGSNVWIAPEQVAGLRGDPRSDVFAIGVMLYEMCARELPFGDPQTASGLRQRFWMQPKPPRQINPQTPAWLQEIIMTCLAAQAANRYSSAALLAFDLAHPEQVKVTAHGNATKGLGFWRQLGRWWDASGVNYEPSTLPTRQTAQVPIVMVAVPHDDATEATLLALRQAVRRGLGNRPGARLSCITVISPAAAAATAQRDGTIHQQMLTYLRRWAETVDIGDHLATFHVLESSDVSQAILSYAEANHVNLIIMGAATHGLQMQRFVATVPIKVAMRAPCTVMLVKA
ncbi:MAG TPA: bifunctional serine/threonine-protein kinase/universal stress protein [Rhodanobacteraceae bacterium]|jgi:nucleotide-binding universal stress UspA family protein/predicted Ser/Thr protein kinase|nr:bifunctional serine/threonine-protein kinase/universal stress protein [Rhodanobacteraceae bacterium]